MPSGDLVKAQATAVEPPFGPDVVKGEIVEGMPGKKELIVLGRAGLADLGFDPDDLVDARTEAQLRRAMPENTREALRWAYGFLIRYCGLTGRRHDPPTVGTIRKMISDAYHMVDEQGRGRGRYGKPYAPNTIGLVVYALSMIFDRLQWVNPCRHPLVADQLKGYRQDYEDAGHRTDEADELSHDQSVALARVADLGTVQGLRNAAMLRGQFDMGCRADEWCNVLGQDVAFHEHIGDDGVTVDVAVVEFIRTKGRAKRKVAMQADPELDFDVDPVRLLIAYYRARVSAGWEGRGPLWVEVAPGNRRKDFAESGILAGRFLDVAMTYDAYSMMFNRYVRKSGIDIDPVTKKRNRHYTTHSNRIGMIDWASRNGMRLEDIAPITGHSPASPVIHRYLRKRTRTDGANPGLVIRRAARELREKRKGKPGQ